MAGISDRTDWAIEAIPADDAGHEFYLKEYKPFRLTALKQDPDAFGSTHARELAFTDQDWHNRLSNPIAKTFVVVRLHDRRILSAASLFGPMPQSGLLSNPNQITARATDVQSNNNDETTLHFQLTGVYTRAEARGQGLAQAVVKVALERALGETQRHGKECTIGVVVYVTNTAAISFYEKCGFAGSGPRLGDSDSDSSRPELLLHYRHSHAQVSR
ncbi:acyl-CoA N-acyltransferase [Xylariales sp. AK1849]|nr:acyl-CoA N-acyltransferase [Xylariales sp. AK1849]